MVLQPLPLASRLSELRPVAGVLLLLVMSGLLLLVILLLLVKLLLLLLLPRRASGLLPPSPLGGIMSGCGLRLTSPCGDRSVCGRRGESYKKKQIVKIQNSSTTHGQPLSVKAPSKKAEKRNYTKIIQLLHTAGQSRRRKYFNHAKM
jgi:hypothetical protein